MIIFAHCKQKKNEYYKTSEGRAVSMTRLDQLAKPIRKKGEHIKAVIEREKRAIELASGIYRSPTTITSSSSSPTKSMSKSMTNLHGINNNHSNKNEQNTNKYLGKPLKKSIASRSMVHLATKNSRDKFSIAKVRSTEQNINRKTNNSGLSFSSYLSIKEIHKKKKLMKFLL